MIEMILIFWRLFLKNVVVNVLTAVLLAKWLRRFVKVRVCFKIYSVKQMTRLLSVIMASNFRVSPLFPVHWVLLKSFLLCQPYELLNP